MPGYFAELVNLNLLFASLAVGRSLVLSRVLFRNDLVLIRNVLVLFLLVQLVNGAERELGVLILDDLLVI